MASGGAGRPALLILKKTCTASVFRWCTRDGSLLCHLSPDSYGFVNTNKQTNKRNVLRPGILQRQIANNEQTAAFSEVPAGLPNEQRNEGPCVSGVLFEREEQLERGHRVRIAFDCTDFPTLLIALEIQV